MGNGYIEPIIVNVKEQPVITQKKLFGTVLRVGRYYDVTYQRGKHSRLILTDAKYAGINQWDEFMFILSNGVSRSVKQDRLVEVKLSVLSKPSLQDRRNLVAAARKRRQQQHPEKFTQEHRDSVLEMLQTKAAEREHMRQRIEGWTEDGSGTGTEDQ